jgi:hypothetical protein
VPNGRIRGAAKKRRCGGGVSGGCLPATVQFAISLITDTPLHIGIHYANYTPRWLHRKFLFYCFIQMEINLSKHLCFPLIHLFCARSNRFTIHHRTAAQRINLYPLNKISLDTSKTHQKFMLHRPKRICH